MRKMYAGVSRVCRGQILAICVASFLTTGYGWAQEASDEATLARFDSGPDTIDVSDYPAEMQEGYKVFARRCSKCHTLSRPINSNYATRDEWSRYVKRMMRKPGSGINKNDAKTIFDFLVYDSSIRKKDLLAKKNSESSDDQPRP